MTITLTTNDIADMLGTTPANVRTTYLPVWIADGLRPIGEFRRNRRFLRDDVMAFLTGAETKRSTGRLNRRGRK